MADPITVICAAGCGASDKVPAFENKAYQLPGHPQVLS